jgi:sucrose phosphorylase
MLDIKKKINNHLDFIYKGFFPENKKKELLSLIGSYKKECSVNSEKWNQNDAILITYGDSIIKDGEKPLQTLKTFLDEHLKEVISVVHILPFFPFSSDDGFSVIDYKQVNPELGNWDDINALNENFDLMSDLVINHCSSQGQWFKNYLYGKNPGFKYFIEADPNEDLSMVVRPRSLPLLSKYDTKHGTKYLWTTFSADQIDLNFKEPDVLIAMVDALLTYIKNGARIIRLDAIAFLWKEIGTNCLHLPETHQVVKLMRDIMEFVDSSTIVLTETNVPNKENLSYFGNNDEAHMVYQFSLPPLILNALFYGNTSYLTKWATNDILNLSDNRTYFNFTASHDGIGVRPLEGIVPEKQLEEMVDGIQKNGGLVNFKTNVDGSKSPYELNITYFDALKTNKAGENRYQLDRFLLSQTIEMSMQGIPAIYIHSFFATPNYHEGVKQTNHNRTINRRKYKKEEIDKILSTDNFQKTAFNEIVKRLKIRKEQKAFHPSAEQKIFNDNNSLFVLKRISRDKSHEILIASNFTSELVEFKSEKYRFDNSTDLLTSEKFNENKLKPYQVVWLKKED